MAAPTAARRAQLRLHDAATFNGTSDPSAAQLPLPTGSSHPRLSCNHGGDGSRARKGHTRDNAAPTQFPGPSVPRGARQSKKNPDSASANVRVRYLFGSPHRRALGRRFHHGAEHPTTVTAPTPERAHRRRRVDAIEVE